VILFLSLLVVLVSACTATVTFDGRGLHVDVPVFDPTPTQEVDDTRNILLVMVNPGPNVINLRAGPGTTFSDVGDLPIDGLVGVLDDGRVDNWLGVCVYINDGACTGSYWIAGWLVERYRG